MKKGAIIGGILIVSMIMFFFIPIASATWWNTNWQYKIYTDLTTVPRAGYHYNLTVHSGVGTNNQSHVYLNNHAQADYDDIRFVLDDSITLNYWIENNTFDPAIVWINITGNGTISMYYGNPDAVSASICNLTFPFCDDFTRADSAVVGNGWTETVAASFSILENQLMMDGTVAGWQQCWRSYTPTDTQRFVARMRRVDGTDYVFFTLPYNDGVSNKRWAWDLHEAITNNIAYIGGGGVWNNTGISAGTSIYDMKFKLDTSKNQADFLINQTEHDTDLSPLNDDQGDDRVMFALWDDNNQIGYVDHVFVRNYTSPEPVWSTWSTQEMYLPVGTTGYNTQRKLARTSDGYLHRTYTAYDGTNYRIYYSRSVNNGATWTETVLTDAGENNSFPTIVVDDDDNIWIFYETSWGAADDAIGYRIYNGISWEAEELAAVYANLPSVAIDSDGIIHLTLTTTTPTMWIQHMEYNGTAWSTKKTISNATINSSYSTIAIDSVDSIHVAWQAYNITTDTLNIDYRKYQVGWGSIYNITTNITYNQTFPSIAIDINDNVHIAWHTNNNKIRYRRYTTTWQGIEELCYGAGYTQYYPTISIYANNYLNVTWMGKTATHPTDFIIRSIQYSGAWSGISNIIRPVGINVSTPNSIYAYHPIFCGDNYVNIPLTGMAIVYDEDGFIAYHNTTDLAWRNPDEYIITVYARDIGNNPINNFTAELSTGASETTTTGVVRFRCLEAGYYTVTVTSTGYYTVQETVVLDANKEVILYLTAIEDPDYYAKPTHLVEFIAQDIYGNRKPYVNVTAVGLETTMGDWDWLLNLFGYEEETIVYNTTMTGWTDSHGSISFFMVETIEYHMTFINATQGISESMRLYPKDDRYFITVGEVPQQKIGYYITTEQNTTHGNITMNFMDYSTPVRTQFANFSVYYLNNDTLVHTHNFTTIAATNTNTSIDLNATVSYKVNLTISHQDLGVVSTYMIVTFVIPTAKRFELGDLEDWQYTIFSLFIIIFMALIWGAVHAGIGGVITVFTTIGLYFFGWLPLLTKTVAAIILPLLVIMALFNLFIHASERGGSQ